jgi:GDP-4-dehydro-6-deoxy-D-mannose reductase
VQVLVTGAAGFAGSHLAEAILASRQPSATVWGCDLAPKRGEYLPPEVQYVSADLCGPEAARDLVRATRPDRVYHLAAQASVASSWNAVWETLEVNLRSQVNLFEAVLEAGLTPRILVVGSTDEYGRVDPEDLPVPETHPLRPESPYAVSKVGQDMLGLQYFLSRHLPVIRVRPANHIGPRQNSRFVGPAFASQIAAIEAGLQPPVLRVGNLDARRAFTDVRDVVRAYVLALELGTPGDVYNVGASEARSVRQLLDGLLSLAKCHVDVEVDASRLRPADAQELVCDTTKFRGLTGWEAAIPMERSLLDLLNDQRKRIRPA